MPKNQDRLTIRLDADMRAKLHERASALGLDDAAYVRMLIYSEVNGQWTESYGGSRGMPTATFQSHSGAGSFDGLTKEETFAADEAEPLPVEEMDIPPDPDGGIPLDDLLRAGPSILDQGMTPPPQPAPRSAPQTYRSAMPQRSYGQPARGPQAPYGRPGSITRAIGVNDGAVGAGADKVQHANVLRRNMGHFGIRETR